MIGHFSVKFLLLLTAFTTTKVALGQTTLDCNRVREGSSLRRYLEPNEGKGQNTYSQRRNSDGSLYCAGYASITLPGVGVELQGYASSVIGRKGQPTKFKVVAPKDLSQMSVGATSNNFEIYFYSEVAPLINSEYPVKFMSEISYPLPLLAWSKDVSSGKPVYFPVSVGDSDKWQVFIRTSWPKGTVYFISEKGVRSDPVTFGPENAVALFQKSYAFTLPPALQGFGFLEIHSDGASDSAMFPIWHP